MSIWKSLFGSDDLEEYENEQEAVDIQNENSGITLFKKKIRK